MKHLSILVPNGQSNLSSIVGPLKVMTKANEYFVSKGKKPVFKIQLVGGSKEVSLFGGLFTVHPQVNFKNVKRTDLIIIPALKGNHVESIHENKSMANWISRQYKQGAEIASICSGAFLLASTGLMTGKKCSTHWMFANNFSRLFPEVDLVADRLITEENGIYTNGGGFSFLNFLLFLVEKYFNRETAIWCSKLFEIEIDRTSQSPFIIFSGQKGHDDEAIRKAQLFMENNTADKITVDSLAAKFALSRRNFDRRFKKATGNSPIEYLQRVKIEAAKKKLEAGKRNVTEVMYDVGYSDRKAFREVFKKITGLSPLEYRSKYNKEAAV